jgi:hypothetical protein
VAGARVAVDRDLAIGVPESLLERRDTLGVSYGSSSAKCPMTAERAAARVGPATEL